MENKVLTDRYGRDITYMRISITSRCNFNCFYCTSKVSEDSLEKEFNTEDYSFILPNLKELGFKKVRLTGGEPLIRKDIVNIVSATNNAGFKEIVLTTNGSNLKNIASELKEAGLSRVNVSLDTLSKSNFKFITGVDKFSDVYLGILKAIEVGLTPLKINTVLLKGVNDQELVSLAKLSLDLPVIIRFIELMPVKGNFIWERYFLSFKDALMILREKLELEAIEESSDDVASYYKIANSKGKIGFITSVSQHFCSRCNRLRLSSAGRIYPCLFSRIFVDTWDAVKSRNSNEFKSKIKEAIFVKPEAHGEIKIGNKEYIENMREVGG